MGNLFESLKDYFENTPKGVLDNDWKEVENLNEIGPDVIEYARHVKDMGKLIKIVKAKFENVNGKLVADTVKEYVNYSHLKEGAS